MKLEIKYNIILNTNNYSDNLKFKLLAKLS